MGTVLTLLLLPALYVEWFQIKAPERSSKSARQVVADVNRNTPSSRIKRRMLHANVAGPCDSQTAGVT